MFACGPIEWGAISVAVVVILFAGGYFGRVVWNHSTRIDSVSERVDGVEKRVIKVETTQETCQRQLSDRLLKGDRSFEEINKQVRALAETATGLLGITKNLKEMVRVLEQRMWDGHDRSNK
jgi:hypothetical protein